MRQLLSGTIFDDAPEGGPPDETGQEPAAPTGVRWLPSRRSAVAVAVAVLLAAAVAGWWFFSSRPQPIAVTASGATPVVPAAVTATGSAANASLSVSSVSSVSPSVSASSAGLVIDVAGDVRKPGIYRLPAGSRVYQAVRAAGGALPGTDTTGLNMAAPLSDGEQIIVGGPPGSGGTVLAPQPGTAPGEGGAGSSGPVSLNSATQEQLESLPGVGPVLAQKILDWRTEHGRFSSVDELRQVPGIGEVKFAALKSRVTL